MDPAAERRQARAEGYERSRPNVRALVPAGTRRILDLGCSSGLVGAVLKDDHDVEIVGIEWDVDYARDAGLRLGKPMYRRGTGKFHPRVVSHG